LLQVVLHAEKLVENKLHVTQRCGVLTHLATPWCVLRDR
jgi:hypothetical protein